MAIIDDLALSKGGGIRSRKQQAEQSENTLSILIGLGGTGIDCLRQIKTEVYDAIKPDNDTSKSADRYKHIKFIGVDSDANISYQNKLYEDKDEVEEKQVLAHDEMFSLAGADAYVAKVPGIQSVHPEYAWVSQNLGVWSRDNASVDGIRQVGRFMMMSKSDDFMYKLRNTINEGKLGLSCPNVVVHIFSGLGGGIGSGIFLDVCYMVREVLKDEENAYISGYFFLPDVNVAHVESQVVKECIMLNGYASLQELDYCMNLENNNGSFKQVYRGRKEIEWKLPPVDFCHLISAVDNSGNVRKDAYSYAMNITSEYVLEFLIKEDRYYNMIYFAEDAYRMGVCNEVDRFRGYYSRYLTIGLSSARIPVKEINTYLATEIFKTFNSQEQDMPSETDAIKFAVSVMGATNAYDDIVAGIYDNLLSMLQGNSADNYIKWDGTAKQMKLNGDQDMLTFYEKQTSDKKEILEKNKNIMLDPQNSQSIISKLQKIMMDIITNIHRGPIFGYNLLCGANRYGVDNIIEALIIINSNRLRDLQQYTEGKEEICSKACSVFENSRFISRRAAFEEYVRSKYDVELQRYKEAVYVQMEQLLMAFKLQLENITKDFYGILAKIYLDLRDTFEKNSAILARRTAGGEVVDFDNTFIDITNPNIQDVIQDELGKVTPEKVFKELITTLVDKRPMWENNATISKIVTEFFVGEEETNAAKTDTRSGIIKNFADKTMENYLKIVYDTEDLEKIADKIQKNWLGKLAQGAEPLFYQNTQVYNSELYAIGHLSVPKRAVSLRTAADKFVIPRSDTALFETGVKDRIVYLTVGFGFPISALKGIADAERRYFLTTRNAGIHSYEGEPGAIDIEFDDWRKLPLITPVSILKNRKKELPDLAQPLLDRTLRVYSDILRLKLYDQDMFCREREFVLYKVDECLRDDISQMKEQICSFKIHQSDDRAEGAMFNKEKTDLQEKIRLIKEKIINGGYYELTQTGFMIIGCMETEEDQKRLLLDQLGYSPVVVLEAEKNIRIIEEALKELSEMMNDIENKG